MSREFPTDSERNANRGFKLYEVSALLTAAIEAGFAEANEETGELPDDWDHFITECQMERDDKALSVARYIKSMDAEAAAIRNEEKALASRRHAAEGRSERLTAYLAGWIKPGEKLSDANTKISWRKSSRVIIDDESTVPESCWKVERSIVKTEVKKAIAAGAQIKAHIEENQNLQIS